MLRGTGGNDTLRGTSGNDRLTGAGGRDILMGGTGADIFDFDLAAHSVGWARDVLRGGDGGACLRRRQAGPSATGSTSRASTPTMHAAGQPGVRLRRRRRSGGSRGRHGQHRTLVRANTDYDAAFEFELVIEDGRPYASAYTAADFIL